MAKVSYSIESNDKNIDKDIVKFFESATITDEIKNGADVLDLRISHLSSLPKVGTVIAFSAGYDNTLNLLGRFTTNEISCNLFTGAAAIKAKAVAAYSNLKMQRKIKTWQQSKLSAIVKQVAADHNLQTKFKIAEDPFFEVYNQNNETDLAFLRRIANDNGADIAIKNGCIIFFDESPDTFKVDLTELSSGSLKTAGTTFGSVEAFYFDREDGDKIKKIVVGSGSPRYQGQGGFHSANEAAGYAKRKLESLQKSAFTGSIQFAKGRPDIYAGAKIKLTGVRPEFAGEYRISKITHNITADSFTSTAEIG